MNDSKTLFTELTSNEEASMSGGKKADKNEKPNKQPKTVNYVFFFGDINGAGGGAATGGAIGGDSGSAVGGTGNAFIFG
ncbi:hypothetical protein LC608_18050 [Nostoc sp. XA010]|uniref:hypothetical protein n=1 Tax=Nostoc sp. XA010 TaxID=2780407 RepID=UPI001E65B322|nr:hypothetical protein [Nostoc sp. XA010]MCC5658852.1 hypothetical protein [Nostoc sp. XA010]